MKLVGTIYLNHYRQLFLKRIGFGLYFLTLLNEIGLRHLGFDDFAIKAIESWHGIVVTKATTLDDPDPGWYNLYNEE